MRSASREAAATRLLLVRHGETALNAARVLQPAETPLSARGLRQAQALAERLRGAGLVTLLASDLPRAWQTAQAVARACGVAALASPLLHERHFGQWRGRAYDSLGLDPLSFADAPPGGESAADFAARCARAWNWVLQQHAARPGPLAVVTHGLVIRAWLAACAPETELPRIGNTSVTELEATPPHRLRLLNCTRHLGADLAEAPQSLSGG